MHLPTYLALLHSAEGTLATSYRHIGNGHPRDSDVFYTCGNFARQCDAHADAVRPVVDRYADRRQPEPDRLHLTGLEGARDGAVGLLRDLHSLYQLATFVDVTWMVVGQAAAGARDQELLDVVSKCRLQITTQVDWLRTRMQSTAPQVLLIGP